MFAAAGRFVPDTTAGLARKFHTPKVTVARSKERLQRMFQVGNLVGEGRLPFYGGDTGFFAIGGRIQGSVLSRLQMRLNHRKLQKRKLGEQKTTLKRSSTLT